MEALPALLYVLFTLLSAAGGYWIGAHFVSRRVGTLLAVGTLVFFVALALFLAWLPGWLEGGAPSPY